MDAAIVTLMIFCSNSQKISVTLHVPILYLLELSGNSVDVKNVRQIVKEACKEEHGTKDLPIQNPSLSNINFLRDFRQKMNKKTYYKASNWNAVEDQVDRSAWARLNDIVYEPRRVPLYKDQDEFFHLPKTNKPCFFIVSSL